VTYWGPFWPTVPEIHPVGDVFSLPFSVKNSNNWLSVVDIQFSCALGRSDPKNPKIYAAFNLSEINDVRPIPSATTVNYSCRVAPQGYEVNSASMLLSMEYSMSWHGIHVAGARETSVMLTWEYGKWIEGPINE
jgi:hypothetical protein